MNSMIQLNKGKKKPQASVKIGETCEEKIKKGCTVIPNCPSPLRYLHEENMENWGKRVWKFIFGVFQ